MKDKFYSYDSVEAAMAQIEFGFQMLFRCYLPGNIVHQSVQEMDFSVGIVLVFNFLTMGKWHICTVTFSIYYRYRKSGTNFSVQGRKKANSVYHR